MSEEKQTKRPMKRGQKKVCLFCVEGAHEIDYKDVQKLKRFVSEGGKILPKRMSGACAKHQRLIATAIKRARHMALLPYKAD